MSQRLVSQQSVSQRSVSQRDRFVKLVKVRSKVFGAVDIDSCIVKEEVELVQLCIRYSIELDKVVEGTRAGATQAPTKVSTAVTRFLQRSLGQRHR